MIKTLLQTDSDYVCTFLRIIAGIIVFPYGMQKLFGWSSAPGLGAPGIKPGRADFPPRSVAGLPQTNFAFKLARRPQVVPNDYGCFFGCPSAATVPFVARR